MMKQIIFCLILVASAMAKQAQGPPPSPNSPPPSPPAPSPPPFPPSSKSPPPLSARPPPPPKSPRPPKSPPPPPKSPPPSTPPPPSSPPALTCNVKPVNKPVAKHGPCMTQYKNQPASWHGMEDCWTLAFAVAQWGQPNNPDKALYRDDWKATAKAYPFAAQAAKQVALDFNNLTKWKVSPQWTEKHPYVRLCVPSAHCGVKNKKCNLTATDFVMHMNPLSWSLDETTKRFYKGFVRGGRLILPNAGTTAHSIDEDVEI